MDTMSVRYRASTYVAVALFAVAAVAQRSTSLDDHGDDPSTATALNPGETATGEIDPGYDEDYFRLDLPRRATVAVSGTSDDGQGLATRLLRMEGDYETCLAIHNHGVGATRRELAEGTYYLRVSSFDQGRVYEVALREVAPDDHGDSPASATPLALGQSATGDIEPRGDLDYFRFELPRWMDVTVSASADAGIDFMLADANGRDATDVNGVYHFTEDDGQGGLRLRAVLDEGSHYLLMSAWPHEDGRTRSYEVFVRETPPDDHGNTEAEATAIMLGDATR